MPAHGMGLNCYNAIIGDVMLRFSSYQLMRQDGRDYKYPLSGYVGINYSALEVMVPYHRVNENNVKLKTSIVKS